MTNGIFGSPTDPLDPLRNPFEEDPPPSDRGSRVPARDRVRALPPVFSTRELVSLLGVTRGHADVMVHSWRRQGWVRTLGKRRAGVHFNLYKIRGSLLPHLAEAMRALTGQTNVLIGGMAVHGGGWTTQVHRVHEVAVGVDSRFRTVPTGLEGVGLRPMPRPAGWMAALIADAWPDGPRGEPRTGFGAFPMVSPAMALADAILAHARNLGPSVNAPLPWKPDHDDVEIPDQAGFDEVVGHLAELGATAGEMDLAEPYRASVWDAGAAPRP